jgi:hypothetical protein
MRCSGLYRACGILRQFDRELPAHLGNCDFDVGLAFWRFDTTFGCQIRFEETEVMNAPTFFFLYILPFVIAGTAWAGILFSEWYEHRKVRIRSGK